MADSQGLRTWGAADKLAAHTFRLADKQEVPDKQEHRSSSCMPVRFPSRILVLIPRHTLDTHIRAIRPSDRRPSDRLRGLPIRVRHGGQQFQLGA